ATEHVATEAAVYEVVALTSDHEVAAGSPGQLVVPGAAVEHRARNVGVLDRVVAIARLDVDRARDTGPVAGHLVGIAGDRVTFRAGRDDGSRIIDRVDAAREGDGDVV